MERWERICAILQSTGHEALNWGPELPRQTVVNVRSKKDNAIPEFVLEQLRAEGCTKLVFIKVTKTCGSDTVRLQQRVSLRLN